LPHARVGVLACCGREPSADDYQTHLGGSPIDPVVPRPYLAVRSGAGPWYPPRRLPPLSARVDAAGVSPNGVGLLTPGRDVLAAGEPPYTEERGVYMQVKCSKCSEPIALSDVIESSDGRLSHIDCMRPPMLTVEERAFLFVY